MRKIYFLPALEVPNRIPRGRFTFPVAAYECQLLGCRHGLLLSYHDPRKQLLVWEPVTGDQHRLDIPPGFYTAGKPINAAVLRTAGNVQNFKVVFGRHQQQEWGNLITGMLPYEAPMSDLPTLSFCCRPVLMVRDSLYWLLTGNLHSNHEFDLARRSLAVIPMLVDATLGTGNHIIWLMPAEGGGLGFLFLFSAQLWIMKKDRDGVASRVLGRSIQLDKLLPLHPRMLPWIVGFAEDNNEVLPCTSIGIVTVQLESLQFKKLFESDGWNYFYPFVVYTAVLHEPQGPMRGSSADAGTPARPSPFGA